LGLLAYLPFSIRREDLPQVFLMRSQKDRALKKARRHAHQEIARLD
jgi:hypothetical protein